MEKRLLKVEAPYLSTERLCSLFRDYKSPLDKISYLAKNGDLIRVRRNLYLLGKDYQQAYSKEVLAGVIYGPSAISFEYALSYYGMIPERVEIITSICPKRAKEFNTPVGIFSYRYIKENIYSIGLEYVQSELGAFFIASKEKALCDLAYHQKIESEKKALEYLIEDLRIDEHYLKNLRLDLLTELKNHYRRLSIQNLVDGIIIAQSR